MPARLVELPRTVLVTLVRAYQRFLSPVLPPACRFTPSCSAYAVTALERYGAARGTWMALRRLARCHPWNPGGYDPVPDRNQRQVTD
jgi:putative membrane protein insertion efficiency factor